LLIEWRVITTFSIYVVREEVMAIVHTTNRWIDIAFSIGVEGRLTEICGER